MRKTRSGEKKLAKENHIVALKAHSREKEQT
jgi:hypothetical protein